MIISSYLQTSFLFFYSTRFRAFKLSVLSPNLSIIIYSTCRRGFFSNNKNDDSNVAPASTAIARICRLYPSAQACRAAIYPDGGRFLMVSADAKRDDSCEGVNTGPSDLEMWLLNRFVQIAIPVQPPSARNWPTLPTPTAMNTSAWSSDLQ